MKRARGGRFWNTLLTRQDREKLGSLRGSQSILFRLKNVLSDDPLSTEIEGLLDSKLNVFVFKNGAYDLDTGVFRPIAWDDYATFTADYDYVPRDEVAKEHFDFIHGFYELLLPHTDERELMMRGAASALSGVRADKSFMLLTDVSGGNNGKSTLLKGLEKVFGGYAVKNLNAVRYSSNNESGQAHSTNDMYFRNRRIGFFDETTSEKKLNMAKLKLLTSPEAEVTLRAAHAADCTEFQWTAYIMLLTRATCQSSSHAMRH